MKNITKSVWLYFLLTYSLSWLFWLPEVLSSQGINGPIILMILYVIGGFGPTIAAFILTFVNDGRNGVKNLLNRALNYRIEKRWVAVIFGLMPAILGIVYIIHVLTDSPIPESGLLSNPLLIIPTFFIIFFFGGAVTEEFGWRGYALDRLQSKFNSLTSSLILGILWGFWHLPLFYIVGTSQVNMSIWLFVINSILLSFLFTWLHNNTNGNILTAILFHTMVNLSYSFLPFVMTSFGFISVIFVTLIINIVIVFRWGPKSLSKSTVNAKL